METSVHTPLPDKAPGPLHEFFVKEGFGKVVPPNVLYMHKRTVVIIFARNQGWGCLRTIYGDKDQTECRRLTSFLVLFFLFWRAAA